MSRGLRRGRDYVQASKAHIRRWENPVSVKETLKDLQKKETEQQKTTDKQSCVSR
jgi:hypothetical protein